VDELHIRVSKYLQLDPVSLPLPLPVHRPILQFGI